MHHGLKKKMVLVWFCTCVNFLIQLKVFLYLKTVLRAVSADLCTMLLLQHNIQQIIILVFLR